ncbi:MAG: hypothetical protein HW384_1642 [Dehalococcoidia bacterium]|nr:hypothetical protein [Dehalococcoidia bacterium]MBF8304009.1 hypothetical protein [Dehalococcoidia bacterium]
MGRTIFWSVIALVFLALTIVTSRGLRNLQQKLGTLGNRGGAILNPQKNGFIPVDGTFYQTLKGILITYIVGFFAAAGAAIAPIFLP